MGGKFAEGEARNGIVVGGNARPPAAEERRRGVEVGDGYAPEKSRRQRRVVVGALHHAAGDRVVRLQTQGILMGCSVFTTTLMSQQKWYSQKIPSAMCSMH